MFAHFTSIDNRSDLIKTYTDDKMIDEINDLQKKTTRVRAELALLAPILLAVVLDPQSLRPSRQHLNLQHSHLLFILFIHLQYVLVETIQEPGLLFPHLHLSLGLLEKSQQGFFFLVELSEPFLYQDLVDSYNYKLIL